MIRVLRAMPALFVALALLISVTAAHAAEPINTLEKKGFFSYKPSGIAIRGYDPVAYFTQGGPTEGSEQFSYEWEGAVWHFSSQEHLDLFTAEPTRYAPQYGGYCAYGVAVDALVKIEPEFWAIIDDKLYLNYSDKFQKLWEKDPEGYIVTADEKFSDLLASE